MPINTKQHNDGEKGHADNDWISCSVCFNFKQQIRDLLNKVYDDSEIDDFVSYMELYNGLLDDDTCFTCTCNQPPRFLMQSTLTLLHPDIARLYKKVLKSNCHCHGKKENAN